MTLEPEPSDQILGRMVERSVEQAVFGTRRDLVKLVGAGTATTRSIEARW